jgi:hypothetical protein
MKKLQIHQESVDLLRNKKSQNFIRGKINSTYAAISIGIYDSQRQNVD